MENSLDTVHRKHSSTANSITLPRSPKLTNLQRSVSQDCDSPSTPKHRVTIKNIEFEDPSQYNDTIDKYYQRNHYTVTGNYQNPLTLPRNISSHRFQVDKADSDVISYCKNVDPRATDTKPIIEDRHFDKSFYWFAMHRKKFGFRYLALCFLALLYTLFGATVFYLIEGSYELERLRMREQNMDQLLDRLAQEFSEAVNDPEQSYTHRKMKELIKESYIELQKEEEQYKWSTYYRLENPSHLKWSFSSSFFFSMNIYTTTGYGMQSLLIVHNNPTPLTGSISAQTTAGQLFTMLYAFCFVPMTLVILRDLGQMFLVNFTKLYAHGLTLVRRVRGRREIDEDEMIQLPIKFCMGILVAYLLLCTTFVYLYDALMGPKWDAGLPYFTAFYFSFISLSTIGLGDVMPNNVPYAPPVSILFFIGMAVTKVVNRATYIAVENGVFGIMTMAETKVDNLLAQKTKNNEHENENEESSDNSSDDGAMDRRRNELMNSFTVRSIATFMRSNHDVYGGGFGRVQLRRGDLLMNNAHTVAVGTSRRIRPEI
uniref:Ion_trans_2 domain-containing protein n=1 Tax=Caenorhabditis japonica TaxID=281687 RepID=A0A8R1E0C0_CAEJA